MIIIPILLNTVVLVIVIIALILAIPFHYCRHIALVSLLLLIIVLTVTFVWVAVKKPELSHQNPKTMLFTILINIVVT